MIEKKGKRKITVEKREVKKAEKRQAGRKKGSKQKLEEYLNLERHLSCEHIKQIISFKKKRRSIIDRKNNSIVGCH